MDGSQTRRPNTALLTPQTLRTPQSLGLTTNVAVPAPRGTRTAVVPNEAGWLPMPAARIQVPRQRAMAAASRATAGLANFPGQARRRTRPPIVVSVRASPREANERVASSRGNNQPATNCGGKGGAF